MNRAMEVAMSVMASTMTLPEAFAGAKVEDGGCEENERYQGEKEVPHLGLRMGGMCIGSGEMFLRIL